MALETHSVNAYADMARFVALRGAVRSGDEDSFAEVAKEFEALFVQLMLRTARDASIDGGLFQSRELEFYNEMLDSQVAMAVATQGSLGFEPMLRQQLIPEPQETPDGAELKIPERIAFPAPKASEVDDSGASAPASGLTESRSEADSPEHAFVREITPRAKAVAEKLGLSPDVLVAQAALETGWGRHIIQHPDGSSSNNLFGIKADRRWDGPIVKVATLEYLGGRPVRVNAAFRAYQGIDESLQDYVDFLSGNPRYREALDAAPEPRRFARALADAGYATDPDYADKLNAIHRRIEAMDLDTPRRL